MFDNCKSCLFYDREEDKLRRSLADVIIIDDPNPDKHYCDMVWDEENSYVIPKEVWENKTKCEHYMEL